MNTSTNTNTPEATIRDGALKATIWANLGEKGTFYSVEFSRTYQTEDGKYHDSRSFSGSEPLQLARLATLAYDRIADLRRSDAQARKTA